MRVNVRRTRPKGVHRRRPYESGHALCQTSTRRLTQQNSAIPDAANARSKLDARGRKGNLPQIRSPRSRPPPPRGPRGRAGQHRPGRRAPRRPGGGNAEEAESERSRGRLVPTLGTHDRRGARADSPGNDKTPANAGVLEGAPDRIRTYDLRFRRPTLYPAELRAQRERTVAGRPETCRLVARTGPDAGRAACAWPRERPPGPAGEADRGVRPRSTRRRFTAVAGRSCAVQGRSAKRTAVSV